MLKKDESYAKFLEELPFTTFGMSVISYLKICIGSRKEPERETFLSNFEIIALDMDIAQVCVEILSIQKKKILRHPNTPDIMIAATALNLGVPLMTNNPKDFKFINGLKTIKP